MELDKKNQSCDEFSKASCVEKLSRIEKKSCRGARNSAEEHKINKIFFFHGPCESPQDQYVKMCGDECVDEITKKPREIYIMRKAYEEKMKENVILKEMLQRFGDLMQLR